MKKLGIALIALVVALAFCGCGSGESQTIELKSYSEHYISSDVSEVTIVGDPDGKSLYGVHIFITERKAKLTINLENAKFFAPDNYPAIYAENTGFKLKMRFNGENVICGGDGDAGTDAYQGTLFSGPWNWDGEDDALDGQCALSAGTVVFERMNPEATLRLVGGDGGYGGAAGHSTSFISDILVDRPNGGKGGDGAPALMAKKSSGYIGVTFEAGRGGSGGSAGYSSVLWGLVPLKGKDGKDGKTPPAIQTRNY